MDGAAPASRGRVGLIHELDVGACPLDCAEERLPEAVVGPRSHLATWRVVFIRPISR